MTKWHQEQKYIRGNNMPFFNKELSSAHTKRTQLRNRYLRKDLIKIKGFILNNEIFVLLYYEKLKRHYPNLHHKGIADSKQFWRTVKPLIFNKSKSNGKLSLVEDN